MYYNYGSNVYYQDDMVYYGDTPVATAADYANQAQQIATSVPETPPPADSWMPLGVFAVMPDDDAAGADPTMFLQLAVSKDGVIAGTLQNTVSGTTKNVEGMVDKETQRAAWTEVGKTRPIMETGIGNLTQDTTPVLVHYADDTTQQWLLVRMDAPPATVQQVPAAARIRARCRRSEHGSGALATDELWSADVYAGARGDQPGRDLHGTRGVVWAAHGCSACAGRCGSS